MQQRRDTDGSLEGDADNAVKLRYRNEWMNDENSIFINKLNTICKQYDGTAADVSKV